MQGVFFLVKNGRCDWRAFLGMFLPYGNLHVNLLLKGVFFFVKIGRFDWRAFFHEQKNALQSERTLLTRKKKRPSKAKLHVKSHRGEKRRPQNQPLDWYLHVNLLLKGVFFLVKIGRFDGREFFFAREKMKYIQFVLDIRIICIWSWTIKIPKHCLIWQYFPGVYMYLHELDAILSFLVPPCTIAFCWSSGLTVAAPDVIGRIPYMWKLSCGHFDFSLHKYSWSVLFSNCMNVITLCTYSHNGCRYVLICATQ